MIENKYSLPGNTKKRDYKIRDLYGPNQDDGQNSSIAKNSRFTKKLRQALLQCEPSEKFGGIHRAKSDMF